ncbi:MAG: gliding motility-associated ABC transporter substrate-binding protein GldG [Bacteroidetes bacterium]|nr:gliding motility-associated ABC transporter substrate-binding protein GldG [Bacteroidota bacterium]
MKKRKDIIQLFLSIAIIVLVNFIATFFFSRFDLTSDKRYTLSPATKAMLGKLDDIIYFKVYLDGDLPAAFDRLKTSTKEMLDEMRVYSHGNIEYQFINPLESNEKKKQDDIIRQLMQKGLVPTDIQLNEKAGMTQQTIFPAALATYRTREFPVQLFKEQIGTPSDLQLNNSIQSLEYELISAIRKLTINVKEKIAFTEGHGELDSTDVADITTSLADYYTMSRIKLEGKIKNIEEINKLQTIIIAKPDSVFSEQNKFIIDQFIMQGGKVLWLVDGTYASMDSLTRSPETFALAMPLNLESQLFKYGARINANLVMDMRSGVIPVPVNNKYQLLSWFHFPLLAQSNNHPIVNNINLVKGEFTSTVDTVSVSGIKKTFLLSTSKYTNVQNAPARIDIRTIFKEPDVRFFNQAYKTVAVLLEGEFESLYKNHPLPGIDSIPEIKFREKSSPTKMIVVADGDVIKNAVQHSSGRAYPLGYDIYSKQTYGNKNFILNAVNYLCDDSGLLEVRSREIKLRMMDRKKVTEEKFKWQTMNTAVPLLLVIVFGIVQAIIRKRKFAN